MGTNRQEKKQMKNKSISKRNECWKENEQEDGLERKWGRTASQSGETARVKPSDGNEPCVFGAGKVTGAQAQ